MHPTELFELVIAMMIAIIALHYAAAKLGLPPAVALITGGALLAFVPGLPIITLNPELVLVIFLPPLLMDGAWFIAVGHLKRHIFGIASLAIGAVVFTTAVVAVTAHLLMPSLPWAACAALGAIVSPPDAISARAILSRVQLPPRLSILLEGESLFNDATGLVLFRFAIAAALTGMFSTIDALGSFALLATGGALVGVAAGAAWVLLVPRLGDDYLKIASSTLIGWTAYLAGEMIHVSGVIATVIAGLICGWYQHVVFSAAVRIRGTAFWAVLIFLLEASVFMLIGSSLRDVIDRAGGFRVALEQMAVPIALIILAMTLARFAWIFATDGLIALQRRIGWKRYRPIGPRAATVLGWAGMRGVVTLAVALSVPAAVPGRDFMLVCAFAVILATVLVQGMSLGWVIRWANLPGAAGGDAPMTMSEAEAAMAQAQLDHVASRAYDEAGELIHPQLLDRYRRRASISAEYAGQEDHFAPRLHAHFDLVLGATAAGRAKLIRLHRAGKIDDRTLHELEHDLDLEELSALAAKN
ncbi:Na+/H+ antiporter [Sphingobium sp. CR28]|uniref:Na+/H+ antiporter n=1 Tax=Sphingobium sp. CR28 TaxID=3400272 RepID=UPI003FED997F